jgi:hypothetical protein
MVILAATLVSIILLSGMYLPVRGVMKGLPIDERAMFTAGSEVGLLPFSLKKVHKL